ncbi:MAG: hypothetical protein ACRD1K_03470 [Acidimicrobiales bacterium]
MGAGPGVVRPLPLGFHDALHVGHGVGPSPQVVLKGGDLLGQLGR